MSTKVIFRRAEVFVLAEVCLSRRPHSVLPRYQVHFVRHYVKSLLFFQTSDRGWPACGRLGRQTSARTKTSARLRITFVDITYPRGWSGSLPLCPLVFSWMNSLHLGTCSTKVRQIFHCLDRLIDGLTFCPKWNYIYPKFYSYPVIKTCTYVFYAYRHQRNGYRVTLVLPP